MAEEQARRSYPALRPHDPRRQVGVERAALLDLRSDAVIGGEKSPKELRDAVVALANAFPKGSSRFLSAQDHNISCRALAPVLLEYFGTSQALLFDRKSIIIRRRDAEVGMDDGQVRTDTH